MSLTAAQISEQKQLSGHKGHATPLLPTVKPRLPMLAKQTTAGRSNFSLPNPLTKSHVTESMPGHTLRPSSPWHRTPSQMDLAAAPESASNPSVVIDKNGRYPTIAEALGITDGTDAALVHQASAVSGANPASDTKPLPASHLHSKAHNPNKPVHKRRR